MIKLEFWLLGGLRIRLVNTKIKHLRLFSWSSHILRHNMSKIKRNRRGSFLTKSRLNVRGLRTASIFFEKSIPYQHDIDNKILEIENTNQKSKISLHLTNLGLLSNTNFSKFGLVGENCNCLNSAHRCRIGHKFGIWKFLIQMQNFIIVGEGWGRYLFYWFPMEWVNSPKHNQQPN